jgi:phosphopantetheinyl transferase (holo-ACP synthase)
MIKWKIAHTLSAPLDPAWEVLAQKGLPPDVHPERKKGFLLAREALRTCLVEAELKPDVIDLELISYCRLHKFSQLTVSLSHTKLAAAAVIASTDEYQSVGIDLERRGREVNPLTLKKITNAHDEMSGLELWCLKEASYKCFSNTGIKSDFVKFSQLEIRKDRWIHSPSGTSGEWQLVSDGEFLIALAFKRN